MKNICYNCSHCKDVEIEIYVCDYEMEGTSFIDRINPNREMCQVGLEELIEREDDD